METNNIPDYSAEMTFEALGDVDTGLLEKYNAERIIWTDTTSSACNWSGLIVKKVGEDRYDLIEFFQEMKFGGLITITVGETIRQNPVPEKYIDTAIKIYFGNDDEEDAFEEDVDFKDVVEQDNKNSESNKTLEIPFDD